MKAVLSILAGLALVACGGETAPYGAQSTDSVENGSDAAEKAMQVSLSITGMT